jgi:hypothetical protein
MKGGAAVTLASDARGFDSSSTAIYIHVHE